MAAPAEPAFPQAARELAGFAINDSFRTRVGRHRLATAIAVSKLGSRVILLASDDGLFKETHERLEDEDGVMRELTGFDDNGYPVHDQREHKFVWPQKVVNNVPQDIGQTLRDKFHIQIATIERAGKVTHSMSGLADPNALAAWADEISREEDQSYIRQIIRLGYNMTVCEETKENSGEVLETSHTKAGTYRNDAYVHPKFVRSFMGPLKLNSTDATGSREVADAYAARKNDMLDKLDAHRPPISKKAKSLFLDFMMTPSTFEADYDVASSSDQATGAAPGKRVASEISGDRPSGGGKKARTVRATADDHPARMFFKAMLPYGRRNGMSCLTEEEADFATYLTTMVACLRTEKKASGASGQGPRNPGSGAARLIGEHITEAAIRRIVAAAIAYEAVRRQDWGRDFLRKYAGRQIVEGWHLPSMSLMSRCPYFGYAIVTYVPTLAKQASKYLYSWNCEFMSRELTLQQIGFSTHTRDYSGLMSRAEEFPQGARSFDMRPAFSYVARMVQAYATKIRTAKNTTVDSDRDRILHVLDDPTLNNVTVASYVDLYQGGSKNPASQVVRYEWNDTLRKSYEDDADGAAFYRFTQAHYIDACNLWSRGPGDPEQDRSVIDDVYELVSAPVTSNSLQIPVEREKKYDYQEFEMSDDEEGFSVEPDPDPEPLPLPLQLDDPPPTEAQDMHEAGDSDEAVTGPTLPPMPVQEELEKKETNDAAQALAGLSTLPADTDMREATASELANLDALLRSLNQP